MYMQYNSFKSGVSSNPVCMCDCACYHKTIALGNCNKYHGFYVHIQTKDNYEIDTIMLKRKERKRRRRKDRKKGGKKENMVERER